MLPRPERASESDRNRNKHNRNEKDIQNINSQFLQLTSCWMIARDKNLSSRKESYANEITTRRLSLLSPGIFLFRFSCASSSLVAVFRSFIFFFPLFYISVCSLRGGVSQPTPKATRWVG